MHGLKIRTIVILSKAKDLGSDRDSSPAAQNDIIHSGDV
jgi:hypothetical protein